jgi:endonuclease-3
VNRKFKKTGNIWKRPADEINRLVVSVCDILESNYGISRLGNPYDPLDDLIFIIISNKTSPNLALRVFSDLKERFGDWAGVLEVPSSVLSEILKPAGLANIKIPQILKSLAKIQNDFGSCDLKSLNNLSESEQLDYLLSLPGVSGKVARCVMLYTLDAKVLPVDVHVFRVSKRLGWTSRKRADQCHDELEALVPVDYRFGYHVDCILHGRTVCRPRNPLCESCCIRDYCDYYQSK